MPSRPVIFFAGNHAEQLALAQAVRRHCDCRFDELSGRLLLTCGPHRLFTDQRVLDGLLFARRIADQLRTEEWTPVIPGDTRGRP